MSNIIPFPKKIIIKKLEREVATANLAALVTILGCEDEIVMRSKKLADFINRKKQVACLSSYRNIL